MTNRPQEQGEGELGLDARTEVRQPPLYKVFLHNDDYTTMDFVVFILEDVFHHSHEVAHTIMMQVHQRGVGVAGLYPFETAEAKIALVHSLARENEFPLMCSMEPE